MTLGRKEDQRLSTEHSKVRGQEEEEETAKELKKEQPGEEEENLKAVASWQWNKEWSNYAYSAATLIEPIDVGWELATWLVT